MTVSIQDAATKAINLGKQLKAVIDIGECLQELGSLEQAITEAKRHATEAKFKREEAEQELDKVVVELKTAKFALSQTQIDIAAKEQEAERVAGATVRKAQEDAAKLSKTAAVDASTMILNAELKVKADQQVSEDLAKKISKQQAELDHARSQMTALKESLG